MQQSRNQTFVGRFRFLLEAKAKAFKNYFFRNQFKKTTATTAANHLGAMLDDVQNFVCRKRFGRAESKGRYNAEKNQKLVRKTAANHLGVMLDDDQNWLCRKRFG